MGVAEALQQTVLMWRQVVLVQQHAQLGRLTSTLIVGQFIVILGDERQPFAIRAPALAALLLDLLEQEHVRPVAAHMPFRILLQLRIDLLEVLVTIAALFGRSFSRTEPVQHLGDHLPDAGMILSIRLERALDALRFDDIQQGHRFRHIEVALRRARRTLMMVAARDGGRVFRLLQSPIRKLVSSPNTRLIDGPDTL